MRAGDALVAAAVFDDEEGRDGGVVVDGRAEPVDGVGGKRDDAAFAQQYGRDGAVVWVVGRKRHRASLQWEGKYKPRARRRVSGACPIGRLRHKARLVWLTLLRSTGAARGR